MRQNMTHYRLARLGHPARIPGCHMHVNDSHELIGKITSMTEGNLPLVKREWREVSQ